MIADAFITLLNYLISTFAYVANGIFSLLPGSPFQIISTSDVAEYLGYLNWIIPVDALLTISMYWVGALAVFIIYSVILRWIRVIS
jgi:hypothetical protein